jgi:hypothetical protein
MLGEVAARSGESEQAAATGRAAELGMIVAR